MNNYNISDGKVLKDDFSFFIALMFQSKWTAIINFVADFNSTAMGLPDSNCHDSTWNQEKTGWQYATTERIRSIQVTWCDIWWCYQSLQQIVSGQCHEVHINTSIHRSFYISINRICSSSSVVISGIDYIPLNYKQYVYITFHLFMSNARWFCP